MRRFIKHSLIRDSTFGFKRHHRKRQAQKTTIIIFQEGAKYQTKFSFHLTFHLTAFAQEATKSRHHHRRRRALLHSSSSSDFTLRAVFPCSGENMETNSHHKFRYYLQSTHRCVNMSRHRSNTHRIR